MSGKSQSKRDRARHQAELARQRNEAQARPVDPRASTQATFALQQTSFWQGPIPPPDDLAKYKEIDPLLPGKILAMAERQIGLAENQQSHRIVQEDRMVRGNNRRADVGLYMGFIVALVVLIGSFWVISRGHGLAGSTIAGLDLVGLVGVFVYGRHDQARQERANDPQ